jgi:hypothetical protein
LFLNLDLFLCYFVFESGFRLCVVAVFVGWNRKFLSLSILFVVIPGLGLLLLFLLEKSQIFGVVCFDSGQRNHVVREMEFYVLWRFICFLIANIGEDEEEVLEKMKRQKVDSGQRIYVFFLIMFFF